MTQSIVELPRLLTHQLMHLAQQEPDQEICGLIAADASGRAIRCYPVRNVANTPYNRFQLDSAEQIAAMQQMREQNQQLFAIYHSHPTAPATPSATDIEQAAYPEALHLIISLNTKGVLEMRAFKIENQTVTEFSMRLIE